MPEGVRRYEGPKPFRMSYPGSWSLQEKDDTVSLWKTEKGGAITLTSLVNRDPGHVADALRHCTRFAEKNGLDGAQIRGDANSAEAVFDLEDGGWCRARILAQGPRLLLATYNTWSENPAEEDEVEAILASLELSGP